jgi:hypothetical protein
MRGQDFFIDLYDYPEECKEFLSLLTENTVNYHRFIRKAQGQPELSNGMGIPDDFAALVPPDMWDEFVVPYWNAYYKGLSSGGGRFLHCEGMYRPHLKKLKGAYITSFQPSVSPRLTIEMMASDLDIAYDWMLPSHIIQGMTEDEVAAWVAHAVNTARGTKLIILRVQINNIIIMKNKMNLIARFLKEAKLAGAQNENTY